MTTATAPLRPCPRRSRLTAARERIRRRRRPPAATRSSEARGATGCARLAGRAAARHRAALPRRPVHVGLGQPVLRGRGAGGQRRAGRRSCSARSTRRTSSPSTSRRRRCGSWTCRRGSSASNSWAILVPQALEGVAAVALLYAAVQAGRRGRRAGLLAGAALATHPGRHADVPLRQPGRAARPADDRPRRTRRSARSSTAGARWLVLAGALLGFAFLTKMLQGLLVVPGVRDRPTSSRRRRPCARASGTSWRPGAAMVVVGRLVDRAGRAVAGRVPSLHRRLDRQHDPRADLRLQRRRPADRQQQQRQRRRRHGPASPRPRRAGRGCSAARWAPRSAGCCRPRWLDRRAGRG